MPRASSKFPHTDIPDDFPKEPRITAALSASVRDSDDYRNPGDHDVTGLFRGGPRGEHCSIATLIGYMFCAISAASPDGERKQTVTYRGRSLQRKAIAWRDAGNPDDANAAKYEAVLRVIDAETPTQPRLVWNGGRFALPAKPVNSGRKRRAA